MINLLYIILGGIIGTVSRYACVAGVQYLWGSVFPYGTLSVNMIGSLLIGFTLGLTEVFEIGVHWRVFLFIGVFGSFTTFSSFTMETMNLLRAGEIKPALAYIIISNLLGLVMVYGGYSASRLIGS